METDENTPPPNNEKPPTQPGLSLSPFGFLAGFRAMLSPSVKDQPTEGSDSTSSRPVLRDMNVSGSSKAKSSTPAAQPAQPVQPVAPGGGGGPDSDGAFLLSPSWSEASEGSFVSAVSTDVNASLPDVIQLASPNRPSGVESDTDTSTAYESAGETEGNISSVDDQFSISGRGIFPNYPIAVSSPFEDLIEPDSRNIKKPVGQSNLNETVLLDDSTESRPESLSVSILAENLGSLTLNTPHKLKSASSTEKAHITLDSDVSADILSPVLEDSVLYCDAEIKESLDETIILADGHESDSAKESSGDEKSEKLNESVHIDSDSGTVEDFPQNPREGSIEVHVPAESGAFENFPNEIVPQEPLNLDDKVEKVSVEVHSSSGTEECFLKETVTPETQNSEENKSEDLGVYAHITSGYNSVEDSLNKKISQEYQTKDLKKEAIDSGFGGDRDVNCSIFSNISTTESKLLEALCDTYTNASSLDQSDLSLTEAKLLEGFEKSLHLSYAEGTASGSPLSLTERKLSEQSGSPNVEDVSHETVVKVPVSDDSSAETPELNAEKLPEQSAPETGTDSQQLPNESSTISQSSGSEKSPIPSGASLALDEIPIKAPRTFEEILAAQLGAEVNAEDAVPYTPEEIPIPVKAPRTFEEILAAELAAQGDPENAVPSFSCDQAPVASESSSNLNETSTADKSFADIIKSETTTLDAESEPELVSDPVVEEPEPVVSNQLDTLIEKCKQQELNLELGDSNKSLAPKEARVYINCLSQGGLSDTQISNSFSEDDVSNQTVFMVDKDSSLSPMSGVSFTPDVGVQVVKEDSFSKPADYFDSEDFKSGDAFKDPSAFDFLSLHGCNRTARDLRKESLYVKFDPLVGSLLPDTRSDISFTMHPENSSDNQNGSTSGPADGFQSAETTHSASEKLVSFSPSTAGQQVLESQPADNLASAPTTPVKRSSVKSTPVKTPAHIMLNETLESIGSRGTLLKQEDLIKKLQEHQSLLEEQDKAYQERIADLEGRLQEVEIKRTEQLKEKDKQLEEKVQSISELRVVMKEYEQTISRIVGEKSQQKVAFEESQAELIRDRDEAQQHLNNMEMAFADIHKKYERLKSVVDAFKKNEESLNAALAEKNANIEKIQNMYDMLKSHAVQKLEKANQDLEAMKQKHQQENAKLKAINKKLELKTKSLEEALEQKVKENQALTAICDELINKVGD